MMESFSKNGVHLKRWMDLVQPYAPSVEGALLLVEESTAEIRESALLVDLTEDEHPDLDPMCRAAARLVAGKGREADRNGNAAHWPELRKLYSEPCGHGLRIAILLFSDPEEQTDRDVRAFLRHCAVYLQTSLELENRMQQALLLQFSKRIQSAIDVKSVLTAVVDYMNELFPLFGVDILLSQDNTDLEGLPVQPLQAHDPDSICSRVYADCVPMQEKRDGLFMTAAPLSGKQGVYGVIRITGETPPDPPQLQIILDIADMAGNALENAKLYEQSNMMINELRLINQITRGLNQSLKLGDMYDYAVQELLHIFRSDYICIMILDAERKVWRVAAGNLPGELPDEYPLEEDFAGMMLKTKEPVIVSDYELVCGHSGMMERTGSRSLMATPIVASNEVIGSLLVFHREPNFFSYDNFKLLQSFTAHLGLAISNANLHAEVRRMVITDHLTGLNTRHFLDEQMNVLKKRDSSGLLILIDIDHFKKINDTYGHQTGDEALVQVSRIIRSSIRESDIAARWGGEEIAIYMPQATLEHGLIVAERIRSRVEAETNPKVTVSCGLAEWRSENRMSVEQLFRIADINLYKAKNAGRNRICAETAPSG